MSFIKYMHVEKLISPEVENILLGTVYVFPKIDGTNASIWCEDQVIGYGSRNRTLTLEGDNAGFANWASQQSKFAALFEAFPEYHLYGEWLVPHSLKTYREEAWRDFYVFDVLDRVTNKFVPYEEYKKVVEAFGINYIPPLAIINNPSMEQLHSQVAKCGQYLVKDGEGTGEGVVLKNYDFVNKYGRICWAKIITNEFKERHHKEMGAPILNGTDFVEQKIADEFCTADFLRKEYEKIVLDAGEWNNKLIPRYLQTIFYELVREECWNFIKKNKNPTIDFKLLNAITTTKAKKFLDL